MVGAAVAEEVPVTRIEGGGEQDAAIGDDDRAGWRRQHLVVVEKGAVRADRLVRKAGVANRAVDRLGSAEIAAEHGAGDPGQFVKTWEAGCDDIKNAGRVEVAGRVRREGKRQHDRCVRRRDRCDRRAQREGSQVRAFSCQKMSPLAGPPNGNTR